MDASLQRWCLAGLCAMAAALPALAQAPYPSRTVTMIVPFPPGGGTDVGARLVAQRLTARWGQSVVVENRGGAAGIVGMEAAAKAKPDGYTVVLGNVGTIAINNSLYKKLPYDHETAFAPINFVADLPLVMLAYPGLAARTPRDIIAMAKAEPGKVTFASSGAGGAPHLAAEIFEDMAGIKMLHVPYKGGGPAVTDLMAGHVNILFTTVLEAVGHVKAGRLRGMAVTSAARSPALPDVPTMAEAALPGYETGSWLGLLAPAGTPQAIVDKFAAEVRDIVGEAETRERFVSQGALPRAMTNAQFIALIGAEKKRYAKLIADKNIRTE
ncbi:MAG: tripartite tricarboxylate transporter substrate binding protein [Burkholderiales bacterium]|nr:tripartite tricarboxylate transporter substrate binding protein [Burkholderiales bacterium]